MWSRPYKQLSLVSWILLTAFGLLLLLLLSLLLLLFCCFFFSIYRVPQIREKFIDKLPTEVTLTAIIHDKDEKFRFNLIPDLVSMGSNITKCSLGHVRPAKIQIGLRKGCNVSSCVQRRLLSDCTNAQADLSLRWTHMSVGRLSHAATLLSFYKGMNPNASWQMECLY